MIERLVGLNISDESGYAKYREAMTPILEAAGGGFGYDFKIAEVLKKETENDINRVFTIRFPNEETMNSFFSDASYLDIRKKFFEKAVSSTTDIAIYHRK